MRYALVVLLLAACAADGPHWERNCTKYRIHYQPTMVGKTWMLQQYPYCVAWDSVWVVPDSALHNEGDE